jgi:hypothetical protein
MRTLSDGTVDIESEISSLELAKVLGLTDRRIRQLDAEGVIERGPDGGFVLVAGVHGYIRFVRDGACQDIGEIVRAEVARALKARRP